MYDPAFGNEPAQTPPTSNLGRLCLLLSGALLATAIGYLLGVHILLAKIYSASISHKIPALFGLGILVWIVGGSYLVSRFQAFRHFFVIGSASAIALAFWWLIAWKRLDDGSTAIPFWLGASVFATASLFSYCYNRHVRAAPFERLFEVFALINGAAILLGLITLYTLVGVDKVRAKNIAIVKFTQEFPDPSTAGMHTYEIGRREFDCYYGNKFEGPNCLD